MAAPSPHQHSLLSFSSVKTKTRETTHRPWLDVKVPVYRDGLVRQGRDRARKNS
jgi:hypothetical protein